MGHQAWLVTTSTDRALDRAAEQAGVIARRQALEAGMSDAAIEANLAARRWQRMHPGVYATFTGRPAERTRIWAALLWAGEGAALADLTALREYGFTTPAGPTGSRGGSWLAVPIHIRVDHGRRVTVPDGICLRRRRRLDDFVHPARTPRVLRLEDAALHAAVDLPSLAAGLGLLADVCAQRLTTPSRLQEALRLLPRLRARRAVSSTIDDIATGVHSFLELAYLDRVERRHGLPTPRRQVAGASRGRRIWRDGEYDEWGVVLELDGRLGHQDPLGRSRDARRDLTAAVRGKVTIRNGYSEVMDAACDTAALVSGVLHSRGWRALPVDCCDGCDIAARMADVRRDLLG
jgi:hypothetical protein